MTQRSKLLAFVCMFAATFGNGSFTWLYGHRLKRRSQLNANTTASVPLRADKDDGGPGPHGYFQDVKYHDHDETCDEPSCTDSSAALEPASSSVVGIALAEAILCTTLVPM